MKTRLTLNLTDAQAETVDWLMKRKGLPHQDRHPRDTVGELLLDYARELRGRDEYVANAQRTQHELRIELDALRRERDGVKKALDAERANRRNDRARHAALRASLDNARKMIDRVRGSRDRYRELAARAEAALLRTRISDDLGSLERRLRLALRKKGFTLPPRRNQPARRQRSPNKRKTAG
ncbi:MAG: hypothetical protein OXK82_12055 [Deltaproteobacteria bacterium]|nr:hypothetical protein [Deltaproteobacteria bacterium]